VIYANEARAFRIVAKGFADLIHGSVEGVVKVHEGVGGPEAVSNFFPRNQLSRPLEQRRVVERIEEGGGV
jgi:hypothetical protein